MKNYWFDEKRCKLGIERIEGYQKKFSQSEKRFIDAPNKANGCSEGADALRQHAQAKEAGLLGDYVYTASLTGMNQGTTHQNPHGYVEAPPTDWRL